jgi:hypothetical protein
VRIVALVGSPQKGMNNRHTGCRSPARGSFARRRDRNSFMNSLYSCPCQACPTHPAPNHCFFFDDMQQICRNAPRHGGEGGIRTHGGLLLTRFPIAPIRPLSHLSALDASIILLRPLPSKQTQAHVPSMRWLSGEARLGFTFCSHQHAFEPSRVTIVIDGSAPMWYSCSVTQLNLKGDGWKTHRAKARAWTN